MPSYKDEFLKVIEEFSKYKGVPLEELVSMTVEGLVNKMETANRITKEHLRNRQSLRTRKALESEYPGSIPKRMFDDNGEFCEDNWNSGEDLIRQYTSYLESSGHQQEPRKFSIGNHISGTEGRLITGYGWIEDYNYIQITTHSHGWNRDFSRSWELDSYQIVYYKNRGKTDHILKNGKPISIDEYVELLNIIESTGFEFDLSV